jgi:hypothetical protein
MTTETTHQPNHLHFFNYHTGRPRFHFDENAGGGGQQQQQAPPVWHAGVDAEVLGFWQNKGLPLDDAKAFATKLTEQYRAAEKFIGVPPDQVVKLPKADAPPEDLRAFYERLGAPKEAKDYDFSAIKDQAVADTLRAAAHDRGLTKDAASAVAAAIAKALESRATTESTVHAQKLADEKAALLKNWTPEKFDFNHLQAIEGARRLGISPEGVKALESQTGYAAVMEAMRKIGANTREDTFVEKGAGSQGDVTTREGAISRKAELMADTAWADRFLKGGATEVREMTRLLTMIDG